VNDHTSVAGQGDAATPPPPTLPPAPPTGTDRPSGPGVDLGQLLGKAQDLRRLDWMGPARVAGAILGVAAVLAVLIGLGLRPGVPGLHWTLHTTILFFGMLWAGALGADVTAHASVGSVHAQAGVGAAPLTITILSFAVGVWLFRRYTRHLTTAGAVFGFALRTAVITAIPPLVVSWFLHADLQALIHLFGQGRGSLDGVNAAGLTVGFSSWGSLLGAFLLTLIVLSGATVLRGDLFGQGASDVVRRVAPARTYLVGPVIGFAAFALVLIPAGLIGAASVWAFHFGSPSESGPLTWHEWMNLVAGAIAYAPNLALQLLALGSAGHVVASASTSVMNVTYSQGRGLAYLADNDTGINHGMWIAVVLAPAVLCVTAYVVLRTARGASLRESRIRLVTWLVSLLVAVPAMFHLSSLRGHGSVTGLNGLADQLGSGSDLGSLMVEEIIGSVAGALGNSVSGHASLGASVGSAFLVFLYAAIITAVLAWLTGLLTKDSLAAARSRLSYQPVGQSSTATEGQPYETGAVINGHRFDGTSWVPVSSEPDSH
jgi:hypothetical protein